MQHGQNGSIDFAVYLIPLQPRKRGVFDRLVPTPFPLFPTSQYPALQALESWNLKQLGDLLLRYFHATNEEAETQREAVTDGVSCSTEASKARLPD